MSDNAEPLAVPHEVVTALSRGRSGDAAGAIAAMADLAESVRRASSVI